jgi:hypothetical protein
VREVGGEIVVYDERAHRAHCLEPVAAEVWRQRDGRDDPEALARRVSVSLGQEVDGAAVTLVLRRLERAGLVARPPGRRPGDATLARRAALCRVGLAGLGVLSIAVPSAAQAAATCLPNGQPCTRSSQCCSDCCNTAPGRCTGGGNCAPP